MLDNTKIPSHILISYYYSSYLLTVKLEQSLKVILKSKKVIQVQDFFERYLFSILLCFEFILFYFVYGTSTNSVENKSTWI